jgi:hypothetical protein
MVSSARRAEVEVGADGPLSAPHSGAAAAAPPADALWRCNKVGADEVVDERMSP